VIRPRFLVLSILPIFLVGSVTAPHVPGQDFGLPGSGQGFGFFSGPGGQDEIVTIAAQFTAAAAERPAGLYITATIQDGWHIYSMTQAPNGPTPTRIKVEPSEAYQVAGGYLVSPPPERSKEEDVWGDLVIESHYRSVTWFVPIRLAAGVDATQLTIQGSVSALACKTGCVPVGPISFAATLGEGVPMPNAEPAEFAAPETQQSKTPPRPPEVGGDGGREPKSDSELPWRPYTTFEAFRALLGPSFDPKVLQDNINRGFSESSIWWEVLFGFLGGIVLNLMPCVLPVIGLKLLSFVEQAGHNRRRAFMLNVWYSAGLLSIFLLLASLAVFLNLGWGHLFKYAAFNIVLAGIVFVMGLSFLGVWEIPIPGFVGTGKAVELGEKEGLSAAFAKGVITTILATPCTGPFMGTALAWAVNQPPLKTYVVFTSVGLGMASPYLLVGAFPALIRFLPKPGAWMNTFKHVMGFVLLGTVVYIFTFIHWPYAAPTLGLLFALWGACWWINRTPLTANLGAKVRAWSEAAAFVGVMWILLFPGIDEILPGRYSFSGLHDVMRSRFEEKLDRTIALHAEQLRQAGYELVQTGRTDDGPPPGRNTVLVDFTADWCLTCKTLEANFMNTPEVRRLVDKNRVVAVKADWTDSAPEVTRLLDLLGSRSVPTIAIFSADDPNNPTGLFRGAYTQQDILDALERAGPSKPSS